MAEHCNNANPCPPPAPTCHPYSNPSESDAGILGLGASIMTTNYPCSCVPLLARPRTWKGASQGLSPWNRLAAEDCRPQIPNQQGKLQPYPSFLLGPFKFFI